MVRYLNLYNLTILIPFRYDNIQIFNFYFPLNLLMDKRRKSCCECFMRLFEKKPAQRRNE